MHGYSSGFEDRQKRIMVTAAREARIRRENTRVSMRDRVRGLEEVKCQIGIQKHGENGYDRLTFITPQPEYETFSLQDQPKISAPIMPA